MSQTDCTCSLTGIFAENFTPKPVARTISCAIDAIPPRVGSRINRRPSSSSSGSVNAITGAASETRSPRRPNSSRASITAVPWSPTVPLTIITSPSRIRSMEGIVPGRRTPTPVVARYSPPPSPRRTTFVSPALIRTPASSAARARLATIRFSCSTSKPSSMNALRVMYIGRAPATARSLVVPWIASEPISPPGNSSG